VGASAFIVIFTAGGGSELLRATLVQIKVHPIIIILCMQLTLFVLGCFMNPAGIILLTAPIYVPVVMDLGFSGVWFGVLVVVNMEMAYLTPPYGFNLFYMKGIVPKHITMLDIYRSAIPFVLIQAITLALVILFPRLATLLPNFMFGPEL